MWTNWKMYIIIVFKKLYNSFFTQIGFNIEVDQNVFNVRGTVLAVLAYTVAAHQLGGFKVGVGYLHWENADIVCYITWHTGKGSFFNSLIIANNKFNSYYNDTHAVYWGCASYENPSKLWLPL